MFPSREKDGQSSTGPRKVSSSQLVHRGILRALYEGRFAPGQRMIEAELVTRFDVSRSSVREALNSLASTGVVTLIPHRGACIRLLSRKDVLDILQIVDLLFGLAARNAALHIDEAGNAVRLKARYDALIGFDWSDDFGRFVNARESYYRTMFRVAGNQEMIRLFPSIQVQIMRIQLRTWNRAADAMRQLDYANLNQAIFSGDEARAEEAGRVHVRHTIDKIIALPERAFGGS